MYLYRSSGQYLNTRTIYVVCSAFEKYIFWKISHFTVRSALSEKNEPESAIERLARSEYEIDRHWLDFVLYIHELIVLTHILRFIHESTNRSDLHPEISTTHLQTHTYTRCTEVDIIFGREGWLFSLSFSSLSISSLAVYFSLSLWFILFAPFEMEPKIAQLRVYGWEVKIGRSASKEM